MGAVIWWVILGIVCLVGIGVYFIDNCNGDH